MSSMEQALFALLTGNAAVNAAVAGRVYPIVMPDDPTLPCITYQRTSAVRQHHMEGRGNLTNGEYTIDVWAYQEPSGMAEISDISAKIRACMDGLRASLSGVDVQAILSLNETDIYESEVKVFRRTMRFRIIFRE